MALGLSGCMLAWVRDSLGLWSGLGLLGVAALLLCSDAEYAGCAMMRVAAVESSSFIWLVGWLVGVLLVFFFSLFFSI